jgi:CheY-like chemotaxis protein
MMPIMDGFEMIHKLRQIPELHDICIIVSSTSLLTAEEWGSMATHVDEFLPKPIQTDQFFDRLSALLKL